MYIRNSKTVATPVHRLCDRNMALYGITTRGVHVLPVCSCQTLVSMFTKSEEKWSLLGVVRRFFLRVLENYDCRIKFNSSRGMEYNGELYGFSAVKAKLVDSLI